LLEQKQQTNVVCTSPKVFLGALAIPLPIVRPCSWAICINLPSFPFFFAKLQQFSSLKNPEIDNSKSLAANSVLELRKIP